MRMLVGIRRILMIRLGSLPDVQRVLESGLPVIVVYRWGAVDVEADQGR